MRFRAFFDHELGFGIVTCHVRYKYKTSRDGDYRVQGSHDLERSLY